LPPGVSAATLGLDGSEEFDLTGLNEHAQPQQPLTLAIHRKNGTREDVPLTLRLDTHAEIDYVRRGGILPYVLEGLMA
jgi:aconitate hydratase